MCKRSAPLRKDVVAHLESQAPWTIGKKSKINDCYEILEKITWVWQGLGCFPLSIKYRKGIKTYELNKILAVYTFLITCACIANIIICLLDFSETIRPKRLTVTMSTVMIRSFSSILCMVISGVYRIFRRKHLSKSIGLMALQEVFLERMSCRFSRDKTSKIIAMYVLGSFLIVVGLMIFELYGWGGTERLKWFFWNWPLVTQVLNLTIFVSLAGLVGLEFRALNEKIKIIVTRANASSPKVIVTSEVCAENLRLAAKAHYNICAVGKRINSFFSWDLVVNVSTAFIILSTTLYYIFVEVEKQDETSMIRIFTYMHWELIHSVPIIIIVIICNWTTDQSILAGKFIHEIRVKNNDCRLYEAVSSFSLQLHHQRLQFTGGGLFPLNSTLLQTMIGSITTYLVILIQFHPSLDY